MESSLFDGHLLDTIVDHHSQALPIARAEVAYTAWRAQVDMPPSVPELHDKHGPFRLGGGAATQDVAAGIAGGQGGAHSPSGGGGASVMLSDVQGVRHVRKRQHDLALENATAHAKTLAQVQSIVANGAANAGGASAAAGAISLLPEPGASPLEKAKHLAAQLAGTASGGLVPSTAPGSIVPIAAGGSGPPPAASVQAALAQAKLRAEQLRLKTTGGAEPIAPAQKHVSGELVINDFPMKARRKVVERECIADVSEKFSVAIISRGSYIAPGRQPGPDEKKLYLAIEGHSERDIVGARKELMRIINEEVMRSGLDPSSRYSVV